MNTNWLLEWPIGGFRALSGHERWLARYHQELFEEELNGWYTDPALWPRDRSLKMLRRWWSFELHTVVVDTGESPLEGDEFQQ